MASCSFSGCKNYKQKKHLDLGITFHRYPSDELLKKAWINASGRRADWSPASNSLVCSDHFKDTDYDYSMLRRRLRKDAVPISCYKMQDETHSSLEELNLSHEPAAQANSSMQVPLQTIPQAHVASNNLQISNSATTGHQLHPLPSGSVNFMRSERRQTFVPGATTQTFAVPEIPNETEKENLSKAALKSIENVNLKRKLKRTVSIKNKYNKRIKAMSVTIKRQKKNIQNLKSLITDLKNKRFIDEYVVDRLNSVTAANKEFITRQLSTVTDDKTPKTYSIDLRAFALTLNFYSPAAYNYVRNTFNSSLPHPKTLSRWYQHIDASPGFTSEAVKLLHHAATNTSYPIICSLVMDEMAIRNHIEWDGHRHHGYVDVGLGVQEDCTIAKNAFVFMVVSINCRWKVPVGYFLIDGLNSEQRSNLIKQCLTLLHETGIKIVSLTCDGLSTNLGAAKELGCDFNLANMKVTFKHPVTKEDIAFILDPCHMLKLVRNTLGEKKIIVDEKGNFVNWNFITKLQEYQAAEGLKLANKLSSRHIHFYTQKMKVKLASQLLSSSVADAIELCNKDLKLEEFKDSESTVEFIRNFNDLFDMLNSRNLHQYNYKKPLNERNEYEITQRLNTIYNYILNLKVSRNGPLLLDSPRKTGFLGFLICIKSMLHLFATLIKSDESTLKYLPMYKFSQDHLEMFFSSIRLHCGYNNNPTARQFKSAYRKLLVKSEIKHSKTSNCIALEEITILSTPSSTEPVNIINSSSDRNLLLDEDILIPELNTDHDYIYCPGSLSEFASTVVEFIAGYVTKQLTGNLKCISCITALTSNNSTNQISLISKKNKGGLKYPSVDVFKICKRCEQVFRIAVNSSNGTSNISIQILSIKVLKSFQHENIFPALDVHMHDTSPLQNHTVQLIRAIALKYFNIRLFAYNKNFNYDKISVRQLYTKRVLFKGQ